MREGFDSTNTEKILSRECEVSLTIRFRFHSEDVCNCTLFLTDEDELHVNEGDSKERVRESVVEPLD